jgi:hypothetical protein
MDVRLTTGAVRNGWAAIAAGPLLILATGIELIHPVQQRDGTVVEPVAFAVLVAMWGLGMLCVAATVFAVKALHREAAIPLSRAGRAGVRLAVAGSSLQVLFAILVGVTAAVAGKAWEASFVLYGVGFLSLVIGGVLLGFAVSRAGVLRLAAAPLWVGAAAAFVAIAVMPPWHDIALFVFPSTWFALGMILLRHRRRRSLVPSGHRSPAAPRAPQPIDAMPPGSPTGEAAPPPPSSVPSGR